MRRIGIILLCVVLSFLDARAQEMVLRFGRITAEDGLPKGAVSSITQDKYGFMWIGTYVGLCRYDGYKFKIYDADPSNPSALYSNRIESIYKDSENNIWIGYLSDIEDIVCRYNFDTDDFSRFSRKKVAQNILDSLDRNKSIFYTYVKSDDYIWQVNQLNSPLVKNLPSDQINNLLIQTNRQNGNKVVYRADPLNHMSLNDEYVNVIFIDDNKILWVGTVNGGINKADTRRNPMRHYYHSLDKEKSIIDNVVRALYEDNEGKIWVGTQNKGVTVIDPKIDKYTHYQYDEKNLNKGILNNSIRKIYQDRFGFIWIGTKGGLNRLDTKTNQFYQYSTKSTNKILDDWIYWIMEDHNNNLWISTFNGIAKYDRKNDRFISYELKYTSTSNTRVRVILEDHKNNLWITTDGTGFARLKRDSSNGVEEKVTIDRYYVNSPKNKNSLSGNNVYTMIEDKDGKFWLGTVGGLDRFDPEKETFIHFNKKNKLPSDLILGILNDEKGNLWLSHKNGLSKFNMRDSSIRNFTKVDGLQDNEFSEDAYFRNKRTGKMFFGGVNGFNSFFPEELKVDTISPKTYITDLQIQNQLISPNQMVNGHIVLTKPIYLTKEITLNHLDNVITIEFAGLHYTNTKENKYAYMLEGFDNQWIQTNSDMRVAKYSNLEPGTYIFKVKSSNSNGYWNNEPTTLKIIVLAPWWKTLWFRILILISLIGLISSFFFWRTKQLKENQKLLETKVKNATDEVNRQNEKLLAAKERLSTIMYEVRNNLGQASEHLMDATNSQAATIEEISVSVEQMAMEVSQNAKSASDIFQRAQSVQKDAVNSVKTIEVAVGIIRIISEKIAFISEIARHTNLLSLNAAIEAARAGIHGKSFSVIANEVKKLSDSSRLIAGEIVELSSSGQKLSNEAGKKINELLGFIDSFVTIIEKITESNQNQSDESVKINTAIQEITSYINQTAKLAQELDLAINSLTIDDTQI